MEWDQEAGWGPDSSPRVSPRRYRRGHVGRSHDRSLDGLDRSQVKSGVGFNGSPSRSPRRGRRRSRGKRSRSRDKSLGRSIDKSLDRSQSRSLGELNRPMDRSVSRLDKSLDMLERSGNRSPDTSPRQYRRAELSRSLDVLLDDPQDRLPSMSHNRSLDMLLDRSASDEGRRQEVGGSPDKSQEALDRSWGRSQESLGRSGGRSPGKGRQEPRVRVGRPDGADSSAKGQVAQNSRRRRQHKPAGVGGEDGRRCVEATLVWVHVLAAGVALGGVVTLGIMTTRWEYQQQMCPLFVTVPPGFHIHWGNEDLTACNIAAFLPLLVVVLSLVLAALHYSVVRAWKGNYMPSLAASRGLGMVTLAVAAVETVVALAATIILTEGFRQTCISFDLSLSWGEVAPSCRSSYNDRDFAYRLQNLHTFDLIVAGLVCGWTLVVLTIILILLNVNRARLCACHCL